ncbi:MAG: lysostaphin resistance A-like protein [bacterium]
MAEKRSFLLRIALLIEGGAFLLSLLLSWLLSVPLLPLTRNPLGDILVGTLWAMIPFAFFIFTLSGMAGKIPGLRSIRTLLRREVYSLFSGSRLPDLVIISLIAGFGEEMLFRGVIQGKLGIVAAALLFGLAHSITPAYVVGAFCIGLYIGYLREAYDSLLVAIQLHFVYDLCALAWLKYAVRPGESRELS